MVELIRILDRARRSGAAVTLRTAQGVLTGMVLNRSGSKLTSSVWLGVGDDFGEDRFVPLWQIYSVAELSRGAVTGGRAGAA